MKHTTTILLFLLPALALAQFPDTPRKIRLGVQTNANYLVYVTDSIPGWTPADANDAFMALDTANDVLYFYDVSAVAWDTITGSGGGGGTDSQTLSFSSPNLSISGGNSVSLAPLISGLLSGVDSTIFASVYRSDTLSAAIRSEIPTNNNQLTNGAGYITGNQTITLSGDVTGSGETAITTDIADGAVDWDELSGPVQDSIQAGGGGGVSGSGAATRVAYWDGTTSLTSDVNFAWSGKQLTLKSSTGTNNVFINGGNTTATGTGNFSGTASSLGSLTSGNHNIGIGLLSVNAVTSNTSNIGIGYQAAQKVATGNSNIALGGEALRELTNGQYNLAIGTSSLRGLTTGNNNVAIGWAALISAGSYSGNTAIGDNAFYSLTSGNNNVGIAPWAGRYTSAAANNTTCNNSVFIGYDSRPSASSESNQIVIGHQAIGNGSNTVTIGNTSTVTHHLVGTGGVNITSGTTAQRPTNAAGVFRWNTTTTRPEIGDGSNWLDLRAYGYTPTSTADSAGNTGDVAYDGSYIYVKTGSGWLRAALSSF